MPSQCVLQYLRVRINWFAVVFLYRFFFKFNIMCNIFQVQNEEMSLSCDERFVNLYSGSLGSVLMANLLKIIPRSYFPSKIIYLSINSNFLPDVVLTLPIPSLIPAPQDVVKLPPFVYSDTRVLSILKSSINHLSNIYATLCENEWMIPII